ncbi:MAG: Mut7-C RNAse domain-containing protein [Desulfurococcales archaeon]|nr:Mut7-C RNAse domain-containing protein [Desulfurococcales archaeon]
MAECSREKCRFVADTMLGELARWLRILGYDTLYSRVYSDNQLLNIASRTGRILLTRDKGLYYRARKKGVRTVYIEFDSIEWRLAELRAKLGLKLEADPSKSRCPECNAPLVKVEDKWKVKDRVPPGAWEAYDVFYLCPRCGRVYWEGGHWRNIRRIVEESERLAGEIAVARGKTGRPGRGDRRGGRAPSQAREGER